MSSGAPRGNKNAAKGKAWRDALDYQLKNYESATVKKKEALREIAKAVVEKALDADMVAVKEIGDRLDGKPAQSVDVSGHMVTETHEEWLERLSRDDD